MLELLLVCAPIYLGLAYLSYQFLGYRRLWGEITEEVGEQPVETFNFEEQIVPLLQKEEVKSFFVGVMEVAMGNIWNQINPSIPFSAPEEVERLQQEAQEFTGEITAETIEKVLPDYLLPFWTRKDKNDPESRSMKEKAKENPQLAGYIVKILQNTGLFAKVDQEMEKLIGGIVGTSGRMSGGSPQPSRTNIW